MERDQEGEYICQRFCEIEIGDNFYFIPKGEREKELCKKVSPACYVVLESNRVDLPKGISYTVGEKYLKSLCKVIKNKLDLETEKMESKDLEYKYEGVTEVYSRSVDGVYKFIRRTEYFIEGDIRLEALRNFEEVYRKYEVVDITHTYYGMEFVSVLYDRTKDKKEICRKISKTINNLGEEKGESQTDNMKEIDIVVNRKYDNVFIIFGDENQWAISRDDHCFVFHPQYSIDPTKTADHIWREAFEFVYKMGIDQIHKWFDQLSCYEKTNCYYCNNNGHVIDPNTFKTITCPCCHGDCNEVSCIVQLDEETVNLFIKTRGYISCNKPYKTLENGKKIKMRNCKVEVPTELLDTKDQYKICEYIFDYLQVLQLTHIYSVAWGYSNIYLVRGL